MFSRSRPLRMAAHRPKRSRLRFSQRQPKAPLSAWAARFALFFLLAGLLIVFFHATLGDRYAIAPLRVFDAANAGGAGFERARLVPQTVGFWGVLWAFPLFLSAFSQELSAKSALYLILAIVLVAAIWRGLAVWRGWRRPALAPLLLIAPQIFGLFYYLSSFAPPISKMETQNRVFDFHCHTTHSNGLLSPQQQINWHRARGFSGLAFTDSNRLMPEKQLEALRQRNPDFVLLQGQEYHGDAHLLIFGARNAIVSEKLDVAAAIRAAKKQGATVVVAHPWYPARFSVEELLKMGADGLEAWNGVIWSREVADLIKKRRLVATTATDTLSKSGAKCFAWTLLPPNADSPEAVLAALKKRQTRAAFALNDSQTPAAYDEKQRKLKKLGGIVLAAKSAWLAQPRAQKWATFCGFLASLCVLVAWGAWPISTRNREAAGPEYAVGFLKRRRLPRQIFGVFLMVLAFVGSVAAAIAGFGALWKPENGAVWFGPGLTLISWLVLDFFFFWGRGLWHRNWRAR